MEESRGGSWVAALQGQRPAGWRSGQVREGEALSRGEGRGMRSQLPGTGTKRGREQNLKHPWRQPVLGLQNSFLAWARGERSVREAPVPPWVIQVDSRSAWHAVPRGPVPGRPQTGARAPARTWRPRDGQEWAQGASGPAGTKLRLNTLVQSTASPKAPQCKNQIIIK